MTITSVPPLEQAVTRLNAGWYNTVTSALNLDPSTFVLAQGGLGLQSSDGSGLSSMSDQVPPSASTFVPGGGVTRSAAYGLLLAALLPEGGQDALQQALGAMYAKWVSYRAANGGSLATFQSWATNNLDPGRAASCVTVYKQAAILPLNKALDAYTDPAGQQQFVRPDGTSYNLPAYSASNETALAAIQTAPSAQIQFDSNTADYTLHHATANGSANGSYKIFYGDTKVNFDQLNTKAASAGFTVDAQIGAFTTLGTNPVSWFSSAEYTRAYNAGPAIDHTVWRADVAAGGWPAFFGQPNGSLARHVASLVLVSDCRITITSRASYSQDDLLKIRANATFGVWPFFNVAGSVDLERQFQLSADNHLSVTLIVNKGDIQVLGVNVAQAPN